MTQTPDFGLFMAIIALTLFGLVIVYSASLPVAYVNYGQPGYLFIKQLVAAVVGLILMGLLTRIDYHRLAQFDGRLLLGAFGLTLLTFVPHIGVSHRWLNLGPLTLQPTEFLKLALIIYLAASLVRRENPPHTPNFKEDALPYLIVSGFAALLALAQSDTGMMFIYAFIMLFMLFVQGVRARYFLLPMLAALPPLAWLLLSSGYRRDRLVVFLDPFRYSDGPGYHIIQALTALGSGGLFGRGLGGSHEKWLYLPEAYNDFIFSVIGEELGLLGALAVIGLFSYIAYKGIRIALAAPDRLGQLLAAGITFEIACQAGINLGVAVGILPVTGLTLPFVSYGGSSLIISLAMSGILLNISRNVSTAQIEAWVARREGSFTHVGARPLVPLLPRRGWR
jgi:cell division protein FtsW